MTLQLNENLGGQLSRSRRSRCGMKLAAGSRVSVGVNDYMGTRDE